MKTDNKRAEKIEKQDRDDLCRKRSRPFEFVIEKCIQSTAFLSLAFIVLIFVFVFREAATIFSNDKTDNTVVYEQSETYGEEALGENPVIDEKAGGSVTMEADQSKSSFMDIFGRSWLPVSLTPKYGILPLFIGSLKVALISLLIGGPIAILAALFTSAFASRALKEIIKPVVEILAGFPSVVIGFVALIILASVLQNIFGLQYRLNAFTGGLALAIAIIPVIFTISEDALNAVPKYYTDASLALGAEKWETALYVVLPAAMPGIFAAILLGIGRAIGETMIVLMATGNAAIMSMDLFAPARTMSATIGAEMAEVVFGEFHYGVLFFIGVLLFAISFLINLTTEVFVRRLVMRRFR